MLAQSCPGVRVIVDQNRFAAGHWLEQRTDVSLFILDDAYQHLPLHRDLNLLLIDAAEPLSRAKMVPIGRLREPLAELRRADAIIITRSDQQFDRSHLIETIRRFSSSAPIFFAHHEMSRFRRFGGTETFNVIEFAGKNVAAVSGIAKPDRFNNDLRNAGLQVVVRRDFPDHHRYASGEFAEILREAQAANAEAIIVTEKDAANLPKELFDQFPLPIFAAQIEFQCAEATQLMELLLGVSERGGKS